MNKQKITNVFLVFLTTFALLFNYVEIYKKGINAVNNMLIASPMLAAIVLISIFLFYNFFNKKENKTNWLQKLLALFFAVVMIVGLSFENTHSFNMILKGKLTLLISLIGIAGYYVLFNVVFKVINYYLPRIDLNKIKFKKENKLIKLFEEKPFICSLIVILLFWLIYLIAFYPGILTPDSSYQILQSFNIHTKYSDWVIQPDPNVNITNHHPVLHTFMLGGCLRLGQAIFNDNFGIFIYTLLQTLILASTLAYTIKYLNKIKVSSKIQFLLLIVYCIVPMFPFYAVTVVKDTIYTSFVILYIIEIYDYIKFYKNKKVSFGKMMCLFILMTLISLFRNNGIYVVVLSFIFAVFYSKENIKRMAIVLMLYLAVYMSYTKVLLPKLKIADTSIRETLSIPFQQTARYVKYHKDEVTQEEREKIDKVLGYSDLADRYNPGIADPVKNKFNKYATKEDIKAYFNLWVNDLFKAPRCYIDAFLNNVYGYFYPTNKGWYLYYNQKDIVSTEGDIDYSFLNQTKELREGLKNYGNSFKSIPVIGLACNIGFNTCTIIVYGVYLLVQKGKRRYLMVLLPHLLSILICMASPVNHYFRYAMPYIFAMPITTIFVIQEIKDKKEG